MLYTEMHPKYRLTIAVYNELVAQQKLPKSSYSIDEVFKSIWKTSNTSHGMALTQVGLVYLRDILDLAHWNFSIEVNTSGTILMMERYMTSPYYLIPKRSNSHTNLILFDEIVAAQLMLYGNDLKAFLLAQDSASDNPISRH